MKRFILELVNAWTRLRTAGVEEEAVTHPMSQLMLHLHLTLITIITIKENKLGK